MAQTRSLPLFDGNTFLDALIDYLDRKRWEGHYRLMDLLNRLWTGIVAAVAAVACALVVLLVGLPIKYAETTVVVFGTTGFLLGFVIGKRGSSGTITSRNKSDERDIWLE